MLVKLTPACNSDSFQSDNAIETVTEPQRSLSLDVTSQLKRSASSYHPVLTIEDNGGDSPPSGVKIRMSASFFASFRQRTSIGGSSQPVHNLSEGQKKLRKRHEKTVVILVSWTEPFDIFSTFATLSTGLTHFFNFWQTFRHVLTSSNILYFAAFSYMLTDFSTFPYWHLHFIFCHTTFNTPDHFSSLNHLLHFFNFFYILSYFLTVVTFLLLASLSTGSRCLKKNIC